MTQQFCSSVYIQAKWKRMSIEELHMNTHSGIAQNSQNGQKHVYQYIKR